MAVGVSCNSINGTEFQSTHPQLKFTADGFHGHNEHNSVLFDPNLYSIPIWYYILIQPPLWLTVLLLFVLWWLAITSNGQQCSSRNQVIDKKLSSLSSCLPPLGGRFWKDETSSEVYVIVLHFIQNKVEVLSPPSPSRVEHKFDIVKWYIFKYLVSQGDVSINW